MCSAVVLPGDHRHRLLCQSGQRPDWRVVQRGEPIVPRRHVGLLRSCLAAAAVHAATAAVVASVGTRPPCAAAARWLQAGGLLPLGWAAVASVRRRQGRHRRLAVSQGGWHRDLRRRPRLGLSGNAQHDRLESHLDLLLHGGGYRRDHPALQRLLHARRESAATAAAAAAAAARGATAAHTLAATTD